MRGSSPRKTIGSGSCRRPSAGIAREPKTYETRLATPSDRIGQCSWVPAFAGMTEKGVGTSVECVPVALAEQGPAGGPGVGQGCARREGVDARIKSGHEAG